MADVHSNKRKEAGLSSSADLAAFVSSSRSILSMLFSRFLSLPCSSVVPCVLAALRMILSAAACTLRYLSSEATFSMTRAWTVYFSQVEHGLPNTQETFA